MTNGNVTVTATANDTIPGAIMQMKAGSGSWSNTTSLTVSSNQTVYARLTDNTNNGATASIAINNIDKIAPTVTAPEVVKRTSSVNVNTITIKNKQTDSESGIKTYQFSINNGNWASSTSSSYTFTGLSLSTKYSIKTKAIDKAGNSSETSAITVATLSVGDTVSYTPPSGRSYTVNKHYSGAPSDQTLTSSNSNMTTWKVWETNNPIQKVYNLINTNNLISIY